MGEWPINCDNCCIKWVVAVLSRSVAVLSGRVAVLSVIMTVLSGRVAVLSG